MIANNKNFQDFKLNKQLINAIDDLGWDQPTAIQCEAIPLVFAGHDLLGIAQTGTGKTAAFVLPILMKIKYAQGLIPRALILAPTRELAMQIAKNIEELGAYCDIRSVCIFGGIGPKTQIEEIEKGVDIIISTPGRFLDLYKQGVIQVKDIKTLVLDEADKMMDMGFMRQIRSMLEILPNKRQNLLFSATMPDRVVTLSEEFLEFPVRVEVTPQVMTTETVEQLYYEVPNFRTKINMLQYLLESTGEMNRVIIFTRTKVIADNIFKFLQRKTENEVRVIHANKGQNTRINSIEDFKEGNVRILVATDVAARGIDVSMVSHVINFDVPVIYEDYVHRIGRTGRARNEGVAITFVTKAEKYHVKKIEAIIRQGIKEKKMPDSIEIMPTEFQEQQDMDREIDLQKRREDPDFKGAFHEKKKVYPKKEKKDRSKHADRKRRKK